MPRQRASYAGVLKRLRAERGVSQRELAGAIGVSQPLVARTEAGARRPDGPEEIAAVAHALGLGTQEHDELLLLAGYWPSAFVTLGPADATLRSVASALTDEALPPAVRDEIRRAIDGVVRAVAATWEAAAAPSELDRDGAAAPPGRPARTPSTGARRGGAPAAGR
jgi:transcriptional regulator with XRE-family HTH domain